MANSRSVAAPADLRRAVGDEVDLPVPWFQAAQAADSARAATVGPPRRRSLKSPASYSLDAS